MKLNPRELEVLKILHASEQPLTSTQIVRSGEELTQSTVQAVLRKLMANDMIEVQGVTHSGNVLSRTFGATEKSKEILAQRFLDSYKDYKNIISIRLAVEGMLDMEEDEAKRAEAIKGIEKVVADLKADLKKK
ncbi:MAG: hypothetical protein K2L18_04465 [Acetatifactor sp.]|nr:hypothetical protein [Acetatifactor sp.]